MTDTIRRQSYAPEGGSLSQFGQSLDQSYVIVLPDGQVAGMRSEHGYGLGHAVAAHTLQEVVFFDSEQAAQRFAPAGSTVEKVCCGLSSEPLQTPAAA